MATSAGAGTATVDRMHERWLWGRRMAIRPGHAGCRRPRSEGAFEMVRGLLNALNASALWRPTWGEGGQPGYWWWELGWLEVGWRVRGIGVGAGSGRREELQ